MVIASLSVGSNLSMCDLLTVSEHTAIVSNRMHCGNQKACAA